MFPLSRWLRPHPPPNSHDDGYDGQLSEINSSSSDLSSSSSSSRSASTTSLSRKASSATNGQAAKEAEDPEVAPTSIVSLLRRELGPRGHLFSVSSQDYINERRRKRLVTKKGQVQIAPHRMNNRRRRLLKDFFNTMLDLKWRYVLLIFTASFFVSWFLFAIVWWLILYYRGDFEPEHMPDVQGANQWQPCVLAMYDFASVFLFSVETQHTIGYGTRQTTEKCPEAIFMQSLQSVVGVMIQATMVGTIFAKLARPKRRSETLLFSRNAVVCNRDGVLNLLFRIANLRPSHLIEAHVRGIVISRKVTDEGEIIPFHQTELKVGVDMEGEDDTVLLLWPVTIVHPIDEESPFYHMSAKDFFKKHYEIVLVLEGIVEPTGMSIQARTSYLGDEIMWGYRFLNVLHFTEGCYQVDYSAFDQVEKVDTPTCSAKHQQDLSTKDNSEEEKTKVTQQPHQVRLLDTPGQLQRVQLPNSTKA